MAMEGSEADALLSSERLSSDSPVMWPDQHHFFGDFNPLHLSPAPPKWLVEVTKDDMEAINELASLTPSQLMEKIRALQNLAYQLGVEEAKQMSRGKYLNVFDPGDRAGEKAAGVVGWGGGGEAGEWSVGGQFEWSQRTSKKSRVKPPQE